MRANLSSSKGDFLRLDTSQAVDILRTNAGELVVGTQGYYPRSSSRQQSSPAPFMSRIFAESLGRQRRGCSCIFRCFLGVEGGFSDGYGE